MQELAFHTSPVVRCFRQLCCQHLLPDLEDDVSHLRAQCWREINPNPASRSAIPYMAVQYLDIKHFFETQRLRAQLKVCGCSMTDARLVFDRTDRSPFHFNRIGAA